MTQWDDASLVWHYTNADGLLGMIEDRQIWATHYHFVNDTMEGSFMTDLLEEFIEQDDTLGPAGWSLTRTLYDLRNRTDGPITRVPTGNQFLLCGSTEGDELTLWRNYASDSVSFAVGLDPNAPLGVIPQREGIHTLRGVEPWRAVDYQNQGNALPEKYANMLRKAHDQSDQGEQIRMLSDALETMFSLVKSSAFKDERETRVVSVVDDTSHWRFRSGRFGITPFIALGASDAWGECSRGDQVLPIRAVRLSANASSSDRLALNALLESNGFGGGAEFDEFIDENGLHATTQVSSYAPPVDILQADNSLRA